MDPLAKSGSISVLVPCYNAERYLAEALDSVLEQSQRPAEVIVVDDGSTDRSAEVARRYAPAVVCVRQPNLGIGAARNRALSLARGDMLAFLDADDVWPPGSLAMRYDALRADAALGCVFGLVQQFVSADAGGSGADHEPTPLTGRLAGTMLARRWAVGRVGTFDARLRTGETLDWMARLDESGIPWQRVPAVVLRRRIHRGNTMITHAAGHHDYLTVLRAALLRRRGAGHGAAP